MGFGVRRFHLEAAGFQFTEADENGQVNVVVADDMERPTACVQVASRRPPRHEDVSEAEVAERVQQVFGYLFASGPCAPLSLLGPMFRVRRQQLVETGLELAWPYDGFLEFLHSDLKRLAPQTLELRGLCGFLRR